MPAKTTARTVADYKAAFDPDVIVPNKIRAALATLLKEGAEHWEYEIDFTKRAGLNATQFARYRDEFKAHFVETPSTGGRSPKRVWFSDAKVAKKLRGE